MASYGRGIQETHQYGDESEVLAVWLLLPSRDTRGAILVAPSGFVLQIDPFEKDEVGVTYNDEVSCTGAKPVWITDGVYR